MVELVRLIDNQNQAVRQLALDLLGSRDPRTEIGLEAWGWLLETRYGYETAAAALRQHFGARELTPPWFKERLFTPNRKAFTFAAGLLLQIHPREKLGPNFFVDLIVSFDDPNHPAARQVSEFALGELAHFDLNALERDFLQRLLLNPLTRQTACSWINLGELKAQTFPLGFLKTLAFPPDWEADPWIGTLRSSDREWARHLEFDESLADRVLGWLGDVRRFAPADLGFTWLMRLVDHSEPLYHNFAVETAIKAFTPADFAPAETPSVAAGPTTVSLAGTSFLFTGKMATMPRKEAEDKVKKAGGTVASSVTKKLHYLVIGDEGSPLYSGGRKGDKQTKAEGLNAAGANIRIISETAFLQMLTGGPRTAASESFHPGGLRASLAHGRGSRRQRGSPRHLCPQVHPSPSPRDRSGPDRSPGRSRRRGPARFPDPGSSRAPVCRDAQAPA